MTGARYCVIAKTTEPTRVAYTRFVGVVNAPSRIWMVRDWARREGYHLIGAPRCVFGLEENHSVMAVCEVQWPLAEAVEPCQGEVGVRWLPPQRVLATYHQGDTADLHTTAAALREWGSANSYRTGSSLCEIYWFDVRTPREHWITEVQSLIEEERRDAE